MKKKYLFTMLVAVAVLLSCSKANVPSLEDDALLDDQTRSETSGGGGIGATIVPRTKVHITAIATEVLDDEVENDTIPSDTIPTDTIPNDSTKSKQAFKILKIK